MKLANLQPEEFVPQTVNAFIGDASKVAAMLKGKAKRLLQSNRGTAKLLIYGPPGVGKTRLAEFFASQITGHSIQVESCNGRNVNVELIRRWQESSRYISVFDKWTVKIVNELDTCPPAAQDLLLTYLDEMPDCTAFIGTSNLSLDLLEDRFQTRMQTFKLKSPSTEEINGLLGCWKLSKQDINQISVGCGGNVRAALLDAQSILDAHSTK